jgi:hypothetical protein
MDYTHKSRLMRRTDTVGRPEERLRTRFTTRSPVGFLWRQEVERISVLNEEALPCRISEVKVSQVLSHRNSPPRNGLPLRTATTWLISALLLPRDGDSGDLSLLW